MSRVLFKLIKRIVPFSVAIYFFPRTVLFLFVCGLIDVARNKNLNVALLQRYFFGNGVLTWILSPFNLTMDLLTLPFRNKGIYELSDLPEGHQQEIKQILKVADRADFLGDIDHAIKGGNRIMMFYKWYGLNVKKHGDVPQFHKKYKYIHTIGVSAFNKRQSTSEHFGPLRITLRVLYNIGPTPEKDAYIQVGDCTNHWHAKRLFIFDDTLLHQSFNESDGIRYCMFIDVLRPSPWPKVLETILTAVRISMAKYNSIFYRHWKVLR